MKRTIAVLLAVLMLAGCAAAHAEYDEYDFSTEWGSPLYYRMEEALRQAGRFAIGLSAVLTDYSDELALVVIEHDDASQLTMMRQEEDGSWQIEACNDTIPFHQFNENRAYWIPSGTQDNPGPLTGETDFLNPEEKADGYFELELRSDSLSGNLMDLCIQQGPEGWYLSGLDLVFFQAEDGTKKEKAPYYFFWQNGDGQDGWTFRYYEFVDHGIGLERTLDPLYSATLPREEALALIGLDAFDYPAFLAYLNGLLPDDLPDAYTAPGAITGRANASESALEPGKEAETGAEDVVYYNPLGGKYYHADPTCPSVSSQYWPLTPVSRDLLETGAYQKLVKCPRCHPAEASDEQP